MTTTTTTRSLSKIVRELSKARKDLRIMSHARIQGHPKATAEIIVYLAEKIARLEVEDRAARNSQVSF